MPDQRTLAEKLRAMAEQDVSPNEAEIARAKLATMGVGDREPPRRPPVAPTPVPEWHQPSVTFSYSTSSNATWSGNFWFEFDDRYR